MSALLAVVLGGLGASLAGTGLARRAAIRLGVLNQPNPINRDHVAPTPYLGGMGIAAGVIVGIAVGAAVESTAFPAAGLILGGIAFLTVGLLDDLYTFGALQKIVLQVLAAAIAVAAGGVSRELTGIPLMDALFATLWIVGLSNAFNFIDVSDGLAVSVASATFAVLAVLVGHQTILAAAVVGAGIGFLVWNRPPARIFMGDAGSLFLGFLLAAYILTAAPWVSAWPFLPMLALFAAVPLFDMAFQTLVRAYQGRAWYVAGPDSFAIHLRRAGLSKWLVIAVGVGATGVAGVAGFVLSRVTLPIQVAILTATAIAAAAIWRSLLVASARAERATVAEARSTDPEIGLRSVRDVRRS